MKSMTIKLPPSAAARQSRWLRQWLPLKKRNLDQARWTRLRVDSPTMKPATRTFYAEGVQRAVDHIAHRLDEALELDGLARHACLSRFHFHRVFRGMTGEAPMEM